MLCGVIWIQLVIMLIEEHSVKLINGVETWETPHVQLVKAGILIAMGVMRMETVVKFKQE